MKAQSRTLRQTKLSPSHKFLIKSVSLRRRLFSARIGLFSDNKKPERSILVESVDEFILASLEVIALSNQPQCLRTEGKLCDHISPREIFEATLLPK
jgi:hypothetical protein